MRDDEMITERMRLVPLTPEHRQAFQQSREAFAVLLGVTLPAAATSPTVRAYRRNSRARDSLEN